MFVLLLSGNKDVVNSSQSSKPVKSSEPIGSKESLKDISPNKGKFETKTETEFYQCLLQNSTIVNNIDKKLFF